MGPMMTAYRQTEIQPVVAKQGAQAADREAHEWLREKLAELSACRPSIPARQLEPYFTRVLPTGTAVVVNLVSFEFVCAPTRASALKSFVATFGDEAPGWAFEVGVPMSAGAGECTS